MESLKKSLHEGRLRTHEKIRSWLQPGMERIGTRLRLAARIRLANRMAGKHPKRTFCGVVGLLVAALVGNIAFASMYAGDTPDRPETDMIASMEPVFDGFHRIQAGKTVQRNTLQKLAHEGVAVKKELDSLIRIPEKSHADSVHIVRQYNRLEHIVQSLKHNGNEQQQD